MIDVRFRSDPQLGSETYVLGARTLIVTGEGGRTRSRNIALEHVSSQYETIHNRFHRLYLVPICLACLAWAVSWVLSLANHGVAAGIIGLSGFGFLFMIRTAPVEGALFRCKTGKVAFVIYRPFKLAYTYDAFVSELVRRVAEASAGND